MSLSYALLAMLLDCPSSGYDLNKAFEDSISNFWKATHQQIYRELGKLEERGWIEAELLPQRDRPDKKLYHVTPLGKQELATWVVQPCPISSVKEEILVKTFVGDLVPPAQLLQVIQDHRQQYAQLLAVYRQIETTYFPEPATLSTAETFRYLTLRRGIRYASDWLAWCDEALLVVQSLESR